MTSSRTALSGAALVARVALVACLAGCLAEPELVLVPADSAGSGEVGEASGAETPEAETPPPKADEPRGPGPGKPGKRGRGDGDDGD